MPTISERQQVLNEIDESMKFAIMQACVVDDDQFSDVEDLPFCSDDEEGEAYESLANLHVLVSQNRYISPRSRVNKSKDYVHNYFLNQTDADFRKITRVTRHKFWHIISLIENHSIFHNVSKCPQAPVHWQLACALDRLGNDGQGVSHARSKLIWGIGQGTVHLYTRRVIRALCDLKEDLIYWPTRHERKQISKRLERKGFRHCVGFVDGTCVPIHKKSAMHGNAFMDRKKRYSVNAQIVSDDKRRIIFFMTGHPGSVGDARVYSQSILAQRPDLAFSKREYLLADSAYGATSTIIPTYKENQRDIRGDVEEPRKIERFNTLLAKARVVNEHTIGVWKGRWTSMRGARVDIHKPEDMRNFVEQATACVVLHNLCIEGDSADPWEEEYHDPDADDFEDPAHEALRPSRVLTPRQRRRWEVRVACLAYHDRQ